MNILWAILIGLGFFLLASLVVLAIFGPSALDEVEADLG